jgi:hypothetical protein
MKVICLLMELKGSIQRVNERGLARLKEHSEQLALTAHALHAL